MTTSSAPEPQSGIIDVIETYKPLLPIPALIAIMTLAWVVFRKTWQEVDREALAERHRLAQLGESDPRPMVAMVMCAVILALHEYYGGRTFFDQLVLPIVQKRSSPQQLEQIAAYNELLGYVWWSGTRIAGYVLPFVVWKFAFPRDCLADFGLRTKGFWSHAWIYGLFLAIVIPTTVWVSTQPDFGSYYPFYKASSRSWFDFLAWEAMYFAQFFALEMFFRGFWLGALKRTFGSGAIFAMAVPYCMIHFGKPYLEAIGAIVAGVALGSLSMKTKSIYQGFLVHVTIAGLMDWLSLRRRHCTPLTWWMQSAPLKTVAASATCSADAPARDALAQTVERTAAGVVLAIALLGTAIAFGMRIKRARA